MSEFKIPKKIYYGLGCLSNSVENILEELTVRDAFLITDSILIELGVIDPLISILEKKNIKIHLYTDVLPEPTIENANNVVEKTRELNPDFVIGLGGGSVLDLAKISAVLCSNEGTVEDYLNLSGNKKIVNKGLPKILISTTSGTGSEITDIAVFSLGNTKDVITNEFLLADYAIVDPNLTITMPPKLTAASGIDAFTHALESYTSIYSTPLTKALAMDAMKIIERNIRTAVWNGQNKSSREQMSLGSLFAGISFYNAGVAAIHGLSYPLGGLFKIPHGESNAVLMPYVYDHIWPSCINDLVNIAEVFELPVQNKSRREIAQMVVNHLLYLVKDVGLPTTLKDYGISKSDIPILTKNGIKQTRLLSRSPMQLNEDKIMEIYTNAYDGKLTVNS